MAGLKVVVVVLALAVVPAFAANHDLSWDQGVDYTSWGSDQKVQPGDTVTFKYSGLHSVDEVSKADYDSCSSSNTLSSANDGNTVITFKQAGTRYFICGTNSHCASGMKVAIPVSAASSTPATPTTPTTPSTPGGATPATPNTPSSPTAQHTPSAAGGSRPKAALLVGAVLTGLALWS